MERVNARSIFSTATGFIARGGFAWTCNPYLGCTFACSYCYAAFLPQNPHPVEDWGTWISAKVNAVELAQKKAPKLAGAAIYMSSVTDPYVPIERGLCLTRGILEALAPHQPRLLIQTRGPIVVRDIDVLKQFQSIRVNVTIPTDDEEVARAFEPKAPPLERRWQALADLMEEGIPVGVCVTPMLPLRDPSAFVARIAELGPAVVVTQHFHESRTVYAANTGEMARALLADWNWTEGNYRDCVGRMRECIKVFEGEAGFFPPVSQNSASGAC